MKPCAGSELIDYDYDFNRLPCSPQINFFSETHTRDFLAVGFLPSDLGCSPPAESLDEKVHVLISIAGSELTDYESDFSRQKLTHEISYLLVS